MNLREALKLGIAQLRASHVDSFTLAAELLLLHATARTRTSLYSHPEAELSESEAQNYFGLIERRAAGAPLQHLTGKQEFWGLEFAVTPDVLIPRPETEHVVEVALDRLALRDLRGKNAQNMSGEGLRIADVGTGSGCIAIALAKELSAAQIVALDISAAALAVAQGNVRRLAASVPNLVERIAFLESDLFGGLASAETRYIVLLHERLQTGVAPEPAIDGHQSQVISHQPRDFDLIVSNPPYIGRREAATLAREVREHEPSVALFGGEEGYELYADLITQSASHLKPGGLLVLELGHDSLAAVQPLFDTPEWKNVGITNDLAGIPRVIAAERS